MFLKTKRGLTSTIIKHKNNTLSSSNFSKIHLNSANSHLNSASLISNGFVHCNLQTINALSLKQFKTKLIPLKLKPLKTRCNFKNLKVYSNLKLLKNFNLGYTLNGVVFFKNLNGSHISIFKTGNNYKINYNNFNNLTVSFVSTNRFNCKLKNLNSCVVKKYNYNYNFKQTLVLNTGSMQSGNFGFNIRFLNNKQSTMQQQALSTNNAKILNQQIVGFSKNKNAVKIKNLNQPLSNIFNFKVNYVVGSKLKCMVNKTYLVEYSKEFLYISKPNVNLNFNFKNLFNFKINTKNKYLNNLINNVLPSKMVNEYKNNFNFVPFGNLLNKQVSSSVYYKTQIQQFLNLKQFINAYNFILTSVLGVGFTQDGLLFFKPQFFVGSYTITYHNIKLLINNFANGFEILYNGIVYKNISSLKLTSLKLNSNFNHNIDNLN